MYKEGTVLEIAEAILMNRDERNKLMSYICWDAVLYCLRKASAGRFYYKDRFSCPAPPMYNMAGKGYEAKDLDEPLKFLFPGALPAMQPGIKADCVVGLCKRDPSNNQFKLSHVMISTKAPGICIGQNNSCIGGNPDWSKVDIGKLLTWHIDGSNPSYNAQYPPPNPSYTEVVVLVKPVKELLTMV
jgi:hypothetical protein